MDQTSSIAAASTVMAQARTGDAVATLVFKKALDVQAQSAMQLLATLPAPASNPPHLGNSVDIRA